MYVIKLLILVLIPKFSEIGTIFQPSRIKSSTRYQNEIRDTTKVFNFRVEEIESILISQNLIFDFIKVRYGLYKV